MIVVLAGRSSEIVVCCKKLQECQRGFDLVMASRDIEGAVIEIRQPLCREVMGDMGNVLIRATLSLWSYHDTQCGFKMLSQILMDLMKTKSRLVKNPGPKDPALGCP